MTDFLKQHQLPTTIKEQISNLKELGLVINDDEALELTLNSVSYFRLIKAYSIGLKDSSGKYIDSISVDRIIALYRFNSELRHILFPVIEHIEIFLRCQIGNYFSLKYGVLGYKDSSHFVDAEYHSKFIDDIDSEIIRNKRNPFVKNFQDNYEGGSLPFYALVEIVSFGDLSKFYKNMLPSDKKILSKESLGVGYTYFESWMESIAYVRNVCAHYGRLYNAKLSKSPTLYDEYRKLGIHNNKLFAVLLCIKHCKIPASIWDTFISQLIMLVSKYPDADLLTMGFPKDWTALLIK